MDFVMTIYDAKILHDGKSIIDIKVTNSMTTDLIVAIVTVYFKIHNWTQLEQQLI